MSDICDAKKSVRQKKLNDLRKESERDSIKIKSLQNKLRRLLSKQEKTKNEALFKTNGIEKQGKMPPVDESSDSESLSPSPSTSHIEKINFDYEPDVEIKQENDEDTKITPVAVSTEMPMPKILTRKQTDIFLSFMEEHVEFANNKLCSKNPGPAGRRLISELWDELANKLSSIPGGTKRQGDAWRRFWNEKKYNIRRKIEQINESHSYNKPIKTKVTDDDLRILNILNLPVKFDPERDGDNADLSDESQLSEPEDFEKHFDKSPVKIIPIKGGSPSTLESIESTNPLELTDSQNPLELSGSPKPLEYCGSPKPLEYCGSPKPLESSGSPKPLEFSGSPKPLESSGSPKLVQLSDAQEPLLTDSPNPVVSSCLPKLFEVGDSPLPSSSPKQNSSPKPLPVSGGPVPRTKVIIRRLAPKPTIFHHQHKKVRLKEPTPSPVGPVPKLSIPNAAIGVGPPQWAIDIEERRAVATEKIADSLEKLTAAVVGMHKSLADLRTDVASIRNVLLSRPPT